MTAAPGNFRSTVTGTTVRLDWNGLLEPVVSFLVEAGSASTLANLARLNTGSASLALVVNNVPNGEYFVRVRAIGPDGIPGPPSNEIVVRVGVLGQLIPLAPTNFTAQVVNNQVTLSWLAPSSGDAPTSYVVEAGSASTLSNIVVFDTGSAATQLTASAPNGRYFVRIRARTAAGVGPPSNELTIDVPGGVVTPGGCTYTVSPNSVRLASASGGAFEVSVGITGSNPASCAWSAASASSFITLISSPSSLGPGVARFTASASSDLTDRTGIVRITDGQAFRQDVTVTQPGTAARCEYRVSPTSVPLSSEAGTFEVAVNTAAGCGWSASATGFVSLSSPENASGPGSARFTVPANGDVSPRNASVRISFPGGGQDVNVSQVGRPAPPPPSAPPVESVLEVPPQNDVVDQRPIQGQPPPVEPPNAGVCLDCRPVLNPGLVAIPIGSAGAQRGDNSPQQAGLMVMVALVSANGVPFNRVIVAPGATLPNGTPVSASYQQITLASPRTSANIILNVVAGQPFTAQFAIVRDSQLPTGYAGAAIPVTPLGSGALQVTMTWNSAADMDVHVIEPNGTHVFFGNPAPSGGTARLDVDDTDGFGPENIFVPMGAAAAGTYQIYIVHFDGPAPTTTTIRVTLGTGPGALVRTFTRTTTAASTSTGVNVANVNVLTGQVTEATGTRVTDERPGSSLSVGKKR